MTTPRPLLRHQVNPCDVDRFPVLKPVGDALAALWHAVTADIECPCCLGMRLVAVAGTGAVLGALAATLFLR